MVAVDFRVDAELRLRFAVELADVLARRSRLLILRALADRADDVRPLVALLLATLALRCPAQLETVRRLPFTRTTRLVQRLDDAPAVPLRAAARRAAFTRDREGRRTTST